MSGPGGHLAARREGLWATKIYVFGGPGAEFLVSEIQGGAPGPAVWSPSGCGSELRNQVGVPCAFSWERLTAREVAVHPQDPAGWAEFPAPLQGGGTLGDRTPFPSPSSQSQPFWGAWQKQPGAPRSSTHKLPRFGIIPMLLFFMSLCVDWFLLEKLVRILSKFINKLLPMIKLNFLKSLM